MKIGRCSVFGGKSTQYGLDSNGLGIYDPGMSKDTGLAFYEPEEANLRPDLFLPAPQDNPKIETWKRLRVWAPYIALYVLPSEGRFFVQTAQIRVVNLTTLAWVVANIVDRGPAVDTGRLVDVSPGIMDLLRIETDDEVGITSVYPGTWMPKLVPGVKFREID